MASSPRMTAPPASPPVWRPSYQQLTPRRSKSSTTRSCELGRMTTLRAFVYTSVEDDEMRARSSVASTLP